MSEDAQGVSIADNVARIRERIARAAGRAGRRPEDVCLVAAAKQVTAEKVRQAISAGIGEVGENYVQEASAKRAEVGEGARWHFIGHLQTNKAAEAARIFEIVQTVDSLRLAQALDRRAQQLGRRLEALIQVNTSGEASKSGVSPEEAEGLVRALAGLAGLEACGLMTIGRLYGEAEAGRPEFRLLAELGKRVEEATGVEMRWLSMGMSHDFEVAIEEGANLVRIGTGIFGPRGQDGGPARG